MAHLIDKDLLLNVIKVRRDELVALMYRVPYASNYPVWSSNVDLLDEIKRAICILEVKEVDSEKHPKEDIEKEEPSSDDLEEEVHKHLLNIGATIEMYSGNVMGLNLCEDDYVDFARHFAEWQKNQMKEALQTEYEKGRFDMREEMMKMAEDTAGLSLSWTKDSKTKIIIIEEDNNEQDCREKN